MVANAEASAQAAEAAFGTVVQRWYVLIMMVLVYTLSIADRYVISTVLEPIRLELQLTDSGIAFLTGVALALFYVVLGFPISWLIDRGNRRNIIAWCLIGWSVMTAFCGLSKTYWQLLLSRIGVGIGEAGGTPGANSIISDYFPVASRPMALTVFSLGAPIGAWLGADIAGMINDKYRLAHRVSGAGRSGRPARHVDLPDGARATPRAARPQGANASAMPRSLESMRYLWTQKSAVHVMAGERADRALGLGPRVVDADVPDPQLRADAGRGGRHPRADPPVRWRRCDAVYGLVAGAARR